jgi:hypothetical protein
MKKPLTLPLSQTGRFRFFMAVFTVSSYSWNFTVFALIPLLRTAIVPKILASRKAEISIKVNDIPVSRLLHGYISPIVIMK